MKTVKCIRFITGCIGILLVFAITWQGGYHAGRGVEKPYTITAYAQPTQDEYLNELSSKVPDCYAVTEGAHKNLVYCRMLPSMYRVWGGDKLTNNPQSTPDDHDPRKP